jgi:hypothetical protein
LTIKRLLLLLQETTLGRIGLEAEGASIAPTPAEFGSTAQKVLKAA